MSKRLSEAKQFDLMAHGFNAETALPTNLFEQITDLRIHHSGLIEQEARRRKKRRRLSRDGKLVLVALDHPARGVTRIRDDDLAMGDRYELLARARRLLMDSDLDGVVAPSDVLEELLLLSSLERRRRGQTFLDSRVIIGSMNRGGLAGCVFEMEDGFTSITAERLAELRCDGGKMLYRLDPTDPASGRTILACSRALNELRWRQLAAFLEPLEVVRDGNSYDMKMDAITLVRQCGIATALGESSSHLWLKLPYCEDFARVGRATTVPILLLGGPPRERPADTLRDFSDALASSTRARGAIIGRNLLFPGQQADPLPMCRALTAMVHRGVRLDEAILVLAMPGSNNPSPPRRQRP
jgi:Cgl0159-like